MNGYHYVSLYNWKASTSEWPMTKIIHSVCVLNSATGLNVVLSLRMQNMENNFSLGILSRDKQTNECFEINGIGANVLRMIIYRYPHKLHRMTHSNAIHFEFLSPQASS